jgi:hypothetical protein
VGFLIYLFLKMRKIDAFSIFRQRNRRVDGGWNRPRNMSKYDPSMPREYKKEKTFPTEHKLEAFCSPVALPPRATPARATFLARIDNQRQEIVREALLSNPAPFGISAGPPSVQQQSQQPPIAQPYLPRRESDISSLSSGFGDAQIDIPDSSLARPLPPQEHQRKSSLKEAIFSLPMISRFSWSTTTTPVTLAKHRETIYTTTSDESTPRFRTIASWVNHQTAAIQKKTRNGRTNSGGSENMSDLPPRMPPQMAQGGFKEKAHQRMSSGSTNPAFKYHPGDEIAMNKGERIPSEVLDGSFRI